MNNNNWNGSPPTPRHDEGDSARGKREPGRMLNILLIDDDEHFLNRFTSYLSPQYKVTAAKSWRDARKIFYKRTPDVVLLDYKLGDGYDGIDVLREIRTNGYSYLVIIIISAHLDRGIIDEARRLGADQCISKHTSDDELKERINRSIERNLAYRLMLLEERRKREEMITPVFLSPPMKKVRENALRFMDLDENILITGPTGAGKEVLARWIHEESVRCRGPFCTIGLPELTVELFSNELFGHEKGAYTGALETKEGLLELAHGGTVVLDEIGDLRPECQLTLLRVMEGKSFRRVGGNRDIHINIRFIALTNKNLPEEIERNMFRRDLYFRLKTFHIDLPPLRERKEDIPVLARQILRRVSRKFRREIDSMDRSLEDFFLSYNWPGNVREMEEFIKNGVLFAEGNILTLDDVERGFDRRMIFKKPDGSEGTVTIDDKELSLPLKEFRDRLEKSYIASLLSRYRGNVLDAAKHASIPRESFYRLCKKHGLKPGDFK